MLTHPTTRHGCGQFPPTSLQVVCSTRGRGGTRHASSREATRWCSISGSRRGVGSGTRHRQTGQGAFKHQATKRSSLTCAGAAFCRAPSWSTICCGRATPGLEELFVSFARVFACLDRAPQSQATWQREDECFCHDLIAAYELRKKRSLAQEGMSRRPTTSQSGSEYDDGDDGDDDGDDGDDDYGGRSHASDGRQTTNVFADVGGDFADVEDGSGDEWHVLPPPPPPPAFTTVSRSGQNVTGARGAFLRIGIVCFLPVFVWAVQFNVPSLEQAAL